MKLNIFKEESKEKFDKMEAEVSEIFKYETFFNRFEKENYKENISDNFEYNIIEKSDGISIKSINNYKLDNILKNFDIEDKFVQMNNAFFTSGSVIEVPDNFKDGKLKIKSEISKNIFSKTIILVGESSNLKIIKESYSKNENSNLINEDFLILSKPSSNIIFSEIQYYNKDSIYISNKISKCEENSKIVWNIGLFGCKMNRNRTYNFMKKNNSTINDFQLVFGNNNQKFDMFSNLIHIGKSTNGKSLTRGVLKDNSKSIFKGMIEIKENAKNSNSYLSSDGMLINENSKISAIPGLKIYTNDVKATHSTSVSPIDKEKIFYFLSRGIKKDEAVKTIILGYFDSLIKNISSKEIRSKMKYLIEYKWNGKYVKSFDKKVLEEFITEDSIKSGNIFEGHYKYR